MKFSKLLVCVSLSVGLYSCEDVSLGCQDVFLGELEPTYELSAFLPADVNGKGFQMKMDQEVIPFRYIPSATNPLVTIPVRGTGEKGLKGKGIPSDCVEYYTANKLEYASHPNTELPVSIFVKQTKNVKAEGYTELGDQAEVDDVMEFRVGYVNVFPKPVFIGETPYTGYMTDRFFTLSKEPAGLINKKNDFVQEHLGRVTLDGVEHEDVYHLYLTSPQYTAFEKQLNVSNPLIYIKGVFLKEGIGVIQAYTSDGRKVDISIKK